MKCLNCNYMTTKEACNLMLKVANAHEVTDSFVRVLDVFGPKSTKVFSADTSIDEVSVYCQLHSVNMVETRGEFKGADFVLLYMDALFLDTEDEDFDYNAFEQLVC